MAKRTDLKKILIIGSGPIVIGQAAEFDYAGTQACLALREEGYEVILVNSNPATIMTDTIIADKVYMEPLTLEYVAKIIRYERPDAIIPGIGGQTGLNLAMQLEKKGVLKECRVKLLGTSSASIERAEDREMFKQMCESIGEPVIPSEITKQPESVTVETGTDAVFHVEVTGEVVSYKWEYRKIYKWFATEMEGYNTDTLTVPVTGARNGYDYRCTVTFADGTVLVTEPAELTVITHITDVQRPQSTRSTAVRGT